MNDLVDLGVLDPRLQGVRRPVRTGITSGLCRALAARFNVDPLVVRIIIVALTFISGLGVIAYVWGTLLTPKEGGSAPIHRLLHNFGRWSRSTQLAIIIVSSLILLVPLAPSAGGTAGGTVVLLLIVWLIYRKSSSREDKRPAPGQHAAPLPWSVDTPPQAGPPTSIEEWRASLAPHAHRPEGDDPLPTVDLYGPEPRSASRAPRRPTSWLGALVIVVLALGAGTIPILLGLTPTILLSLTVAAGALGAMMFIWALAVRSRRLPILLVVAALGLGAVTTAAALQIADPPAPAVVSAADGSNITREYTAVGGAVLDLRDTPLDAEVDVDVVATASSVRILLPARPLNVTTDEVLSNISYPSERPSTGTESNESKISLHIEATTSNVQVEFPS